MQRKYIYLILFVFILINTELIKAQENTIEQYKFQIAFMPQYIFHNGIRIDFESITKNQKHSLQISPVLYYDNNNINYSNNPIYYQQYNSEYEKLKGYGLGLHHKIKIVSLNSNTWVFYFAYGGEYTHFTLNKKNWEWISYTENNLEYLKYELIDIEQNTDRFRIDASMGVQYNYAERLFLDFFIGMGGVYSINTMSPNNAQAMFNESIYGYAYNGIYLPIGFRFGFKF